MRTLFLLVLFALLAVWGMFVAKADVGKITDNYPPYVSDKKLPEQCKLETKQMKLAMLTLEMAIARLETCGMGVLDDIDEKTGVNND